MPSAKLKQTNTNHKNDFKRTKLIGLKRILYLGILLVPILFGFILPLIQLVIWGIQTFDSMFNNDLMVLGLESLIMGLSSALLVVFLACLLIYVSKWNYFKHFNVFSKIATLGYVIPGAIIGGLIIGAVEKILEVYIGPFFGGAIEGWAPYVLAIFFLLYRPEGLFGEKIIRRV